MLFLLQVYILHFYFVDRAFGVADGVGGWLDAGIDSGYYANAVFSISK